ncbi:glutamine--fructose-6-phosphate transaminase (isomerizing) [Candidatus Kaiserbacteria bacterium]|nr:glutamine--fructose-6-phosphate transaminase (isomerizing) [Candidatus Kaiserbacteria bacterium]USN92275.1 MAG: glutamine--fructose-6-phosphate transaminase (isomerizing) [Candidatus Nomurabacteria bacterium]
MCGIFGYVGSRTASPVLLDGLRTLEYRGYDSAGIYVPGYSPIKAVGPIDNLAKKIISPLSGTSGIAHTRWATHGAPTEVNAHPHLDMSGTLALVHNGIIENYRELKEGLVMRGIEFESETDSEVLAKLIGTLYKGDLFTATRNALSLVRGTYGIIVIAENDPNTIVTARMGSPIVLGLAVDGNFVSSDPSALLAHTKDVIYLADGECAIVSKDSYEVLSTKGKRLSKKPETVEWDIESVQKQGYEHFMQKEIFEVPEVIENTIRGRLMPGKGRAKLGGVEMVVDKLTALNRLVIVGCGSAYYAGLVGRFMLEEYAGLPVEVELGSEYRYKRNLTDKKTAVLAITQSGETADTLASIRSAKEQSLLTLGVVNVVGSTIARETDFGVYNHAGPEVAVASTKAFISQLTVFVLLTLLIGREKGLSQEEGTRIAEDLANLPKTLRSYLKNTDDIKRVAKKYANYRDMMFIGRKSHTPIAYEGSLKMKEVTYIHAEAYAGGELKHGSIAMLDENFPVVALVPKDDVYEKMISNVEEVKARKAPTLVVATEDDKSISGVADDVIFVPKVHPILQPIVSTVPLQLLSYYVGVEKGLNVDRPRNLAKSVTVE